MTHVMLDLETLSTKPNAVVTAVGAVIFDPHKPGQTGAAFYRTASDWSRQQERGCHISGDTVAWWLGGDDSSPPEEARKALFADASSTIQLLSEFDEYLEGLPDLQLWGNGSDFDNMILRHLYESHGLKCPWSYKNNRCFRTLKNLPGAQQAIDLPRGGVAHNALDDALHQALQAQLIFRAGIVA